ncbi:MAG: acetyl-CoA acetyltransferase [Gammaproteobacteria bacterium RIFCSPHIGHO2_12_FULL_42_10]|nr:MAG: acetyl-CoA acetyltransferase [Gammaproteobacteria bacterium RIFCSPHIGHO2_12_FULL_42_10]
MMRDVYIVDGARTPFLKTTNKAGPFSASDMAVMTAQQLFANQPTCAPTHLDEVILGCVMPSVDEANIARIVALRLGCGKSVPAWTVQRNCASGMQALDSAFSNIALGRSDLILAGGTEVMSRAPLLLNNDMTAWVSRMMSAKDWKTRLQTIFTLKPAYFKPVIALLHGLTDPTINLSMGQTAEILAHQFNITREMMDQFAYESHQRAVSADTHHHLSEIKTLFSNQGDYFSNDTGVRPDSSLQKLATLKPIFDKRFGSVTAGNSSQVTDGAALLLLASHEAIEKYHLPVLAKIVGTTWAGVLPSEMGLGPVYAVDKLMQQFNLSFQNIDYWEINEAFSAQVLACVEALSSDQYCQTHLGREKAWGAINRDRLNADGGAIALGHPIGASGARIVLHLAMLLKRENAHRGVATICIGGGQGGAMLIERGL